MIDQASVVPGFQGESGRAMGDELLAVIETIYAAGLDERLWPKALAAVTGLVGGVGSTIEIIDRKTFSHLEFHGFGVPTAGEMAYLDHYMALSPRIPAALQQRPGETTWDYRVLEEEAIDRSPFYAEFLAPMDMRYAVAGILDTTATEFGAIAVQRSARQGHVDRAEIANVGRLISHVSRALDMTRRLKGQDIVRHSLEHALDWLGDGAALIRADGSIVHANGSFQIISRASDGLRIKKNAIEFATAATRDRFHAALAGVLALNDGDARGGGADFAVSRPSGAPAYLVSVRPLSRRQGRLSKSAVAIVFIRDPDNQAGANGTMLREVFGFTEAEANVALALQAGVALGEYASSHAVSLNTVYTHLRRIKAKTGCRRLPELINRLNEIRVPLRPV